MERAFGADFSGVRVHHDAHADALSRPLQARAFTTGQDIFFSQGAYRPGTSSGQELIAHELTHVVQQNGNRVEKKVQAKMTVSQPGDPSELEADRMAHMVMSHEPNDAAGRSTLDRQPEPTKAKEEEEKKKMHRSAEPGLSGSLAAAMRQL
jgi:hypothetical protein